MTKDCSFFEKFARLILHWSPLLLTNLLCATRYIAQRFFFVLSLVESYWYKALHS